MIDRPRPSVEPSATGLGYLPTLDGWRAIAILGVISAHMGSALFYPAGPYPHAGLFDLTRHGALGVDLFFGISGFLICSRLLEEAARRGRISLAGFYIRRACRIFPPYATTLLVIGVLTAYAGLSVNRQEWISCVLFFRNYLPDQAPERWYTGHFWSLAVEEHFYLLLPGLLVLLGSARARWCVPALAVSCAVWRHFEFHLHLLDRWLPAVALYERTDIRLDALLWGAWVAMAMRDEQWRSWLTRGLAIAKSPLAFIAVILAAVLIQPPISLLSILIPLLVVSTVMYSEGLPGRVLEAAPLRWIGRLSYSLYLWQQLFLVGSQVPRPLPFGAVQEFPYNLAAVFACAALSYYLVERPMIRLGHRLAQPATPGRDTAAVIPRAELAIR